MTDIALLLALRHAGVLEASRDLGIDASRTFLPLIETRHHHYGRYRWSVSLDGADGPMIHARPPEEETGWTPWERWSAGDGGPEHRSWIRDPGNGTTGSSTSPDSWVLLDEDPGDHRPRQLLPPADLASQLERARVVAAGRYIGLDVSAAILDPMGERANQRYTNYRWVVIPHWLAADGPVLYACPPATTSDAWPWESWYVQRSGGPIVHHVHYTAARPGCTGRWREPLGAPQRPPEILDVTWWWYDDPEVRPAMCAARHP